MKTILLLALCIGFMISSDAQPILPADFKLLKAKEDSMKIPAATLTATVSK
jgi:hypothetical protein